MKTPITRISARQYLGAALILTAFACGQGNGINDMYSAQRAALNYKSPTALGGAPTGPIVVDAGVANTTGTNATGTNHTGIAENNTGVSSATGAVTSADPSATGTSGTAGSTVGSNDSAPNSTGNPLDGAVGSVGTPTSVMPSNCGLEVKEKTFAARQFTNDELMDLQIRKSAKDDSIFQTLPYKNTKKHLMSLYQLGWHSGVTRDGHHFVDDAQVVFAIDLKDLPPRDAVNKLFSAQLRMKVNKIAKEQFTETEVLCFIDERICSGELFKNPTWLDSINREFFPTGSPVNNSFSKQYLTRPIGTVKGQKLYGAELVLELEQLLANSETSPMALLYSNEASDRPASRTLKMVVADDTFVSPDVTLKVTYEEDTCKTAALAQTTSAASAQN